MRPPVENGVAPAEGGSTGAVAERVDGAPRIGVPASLSEPLTHIESTIWHSTHTAIVSRVFKKKRTQAAATTAKGTTVAWPLMLCKQELLCPCSPKVQPLRWPA